jgi:hypothetical protein
LSHFFVKFKKFMIYKTTKKRTTQDWFDEDESRDLIWRLPERKSISRINAAAKGLPGGKRGRIFQCKAAWLVAGRVASTWLHQFYSAYMPKCLFTTTALHTSGKLLALADDTPCSLSQNNYGVYARRREPEDGVVHDGKFGVVGGHQHPFISQKFGSQQVQDSMTFPHKLDNGLILRLLDNLQIHQTTPRP